ncbi:MAG: DASS family sodium-coupled anion symporter [Methanobrevibacter sp.]|jgi:sodium-dependent dicarboxylate transporter 2/3/5|nr:DASS family sodium-coupled anion symporter [Candidatus Methanovirga aequatorialis]
MEFKKIGLPLAIVVAVIISLLPLNDITPSNYPNLSYAGQMALALLIFSIILWVSEVVNLAVTSLIILFIQPILGITSFDNAVVGFASPILFLMIGGFIIAEGISKSGLVQRLTYFLLDKIGTTAKKGLFVAVFSTGILSAWIENVVAFALIIPIITEIIDLMGCEGACEGNSNYAKSLILGACFASLAGGLATEIGTAPNLMAAAYTHIPFASWMIFGIPISLILLFTIWQFLGIVFPSEVKGIKGGSDTIKNKIESLGKITRNEKLAITILLFTILLWITTGFTGLNSYSVALIGAVLFFMFRILDWKDAQKNIDWGLVLFFGGALSLGAALLNTGAASWLINDVIHALGPDPNVIVIVIILMIVGVLITQVMSNIALAAILVPLAVIMSQEQGLATGIYAVPISIACSLSFMLPMADPTVAMAYGTGYVKIKEIFKAGLPIVILGIVVTLTILFTIGKPFLSA